MNGYISKGRGESIMYFKIFAISADIATGIISKRALSRNPVIFRNLAISNMITGIPKAMTAAEFVIKIKVASKIGFLFSYIALSNPISAACKFCITDNKKIVVRIYMFPARRVNVCVYMPSQSADVKLILSTGLSVSGVK